MLSESGVSMLQDFKFEEYGALKRSYPYGFHGVDRFGRPIYSKRIGSLNSTYKGMQS
jgi:hypothetical protein